MFSIPLGMAVIPRRNEKQRQNFGGHIRCIMGDMQVANVKTSKHLQILVLWGVGRYMYLYIHCGIAKDLLESLSSGQSWGHGRQEGCARSRSSAEFVVQKAKIKQWLVFSITRVTDVLSVFYTLAIWNVFTHDIAFRISEKSLLLKGTRAFSLLHSHLNISSFTIIRQAWNAAMYYLIV